VEHRGRIGDGGFQGRRLGRGKVKRHQFAAKPGQRAGPRGIADCGDHAVATVNQPSDQRSAHEAGTAGDKCLHARSMAALT
jgi:hypothetical protein